MAELFLPDQKYIEGVIADYLTSVVPGEKSLLASTHASAGFAYLSEQPAVPAYNPKKKP